MDAFRPHYNNFILDLILLSGLHINRLAATPLAFKADESCNYTFWSYLECFAWSISIINKDFFSHDILLCQNMVNIAANSSYPPLLLIILFSEHPLFEHSANKSWPISQWNWFLLQHEFRWFGRNYKINYSWVECKNMFMFGWLLTTVIKISFAHTYLCANYPEIIYNPKTMLENTINII